MEYQLITRKPMTLMGVSLRTCNANGQSMQDLPPFWEKFYSESIMDLIPNKASPDIIGLYTDYEKGFMDPYSLVIGCEVEKTEDVPSGFVIKEIPEETYAVFTAKGDFPNSLIDTWHAIWASDLPFAFSNNFEVYGMRFEKGEVDVFMALQKNIK